MTLRWICDPLIHPLSDPYNIYFGGPSREFFTLALQCFLDPDSSGRIMFTGARDHLVPVYDWDMLEEGRFEMCGRGIGHAVLHGSTCFAGLSRALFTYLATQNVDKVMANLQIEDVPDLDIRDKIIEISHVDPDEAHKIMTNDFGACELLTNAEITRLDTRRRCGCLKHQFLRIRYKDEDGDHVNLIEDDVENSNDSLVRDPCEGDGGYGKIQLRVVITSTMKPLPTPIKGGVGQRSGMSDM